MIRGGRFSPPRVVPAVARAAIIAWRKVRRRMASFLGSVWKFVMDQLFQTNIVDESQDGLASSLVRSLYIRTSPFFDPTRTRILKAL